MCAGGISGGINGGAYLSRYLDLERMEFYLSTQGEMKDALPPYFPPWRGKNR